MEKMSKSRFFRFPVILICLSFCLGILFNNFITEELLSIFFISVLLFIFLIIFKKYFTYLLILISFFLGAGSYKLKNEPIKKVSNIVLEKNYYVAEILEKLGNTEKTTKYILKIPYRKENIKVISYISINYKDSIKTGDFISFKKKILPIQGAEIFEEFDYKKFMLKRGITHSIFLSQKDILKVQHNLPNLNYKREKLKDNIFNNLKKYNISKNTIGFTIALTLGDRSYLDKSIMENYSDAGVTHLLAVSGLHIGIFLLIIMFLLSPLDRLKFGKKIKIPLVILLIWVYAFLVNFSPSITRACTMFTFIMIGISFKRVTNIYNSLAISALLLLIFNPNNLFEVGFQFSYLAVFAIFWIQPMIKNMIVVRNKILSYLWEIISVSFSAQMGVLPVSLYYFGKLPMLFLLSNVILIPIIGLVLILAIISILLSFTSINFGWYFLGYDFIISRLNLIIKYISSFKSMVLDISLEFYQIIIFFSVIFFFVLFFKIKKYYLFVISFIGVVLFQLSVLEEYYRKINSYEIINFETNKGGMISIKNRDEIYFFSDERIDNYSKKKFKNYLKYSMANNLKKYDLPDDKNILIELNNKKILILTTELSLKYLLKKYDYVFINNSLKSANIISKNIILNKTNNLKTKIFWENYSKKINANFFNIYDGRSFLSGD